LDNRLISRVCHCNDGWQIHIYSFLFYTSHLFFSPHRAGKNNTMLSPIEYCSFSSLAFFFLFVGLLSTCELSPINNENNNQRQVQLANTIVNQPTSAILRYYIQYTLLIFGEDKMNKRPDKRINERNITYAHLYI
jgi:hypothetical protein